MFRYLIRNILNKTKQKLNINYSFILFTGCRRLEIDDTVVDILFGKVADVNFVSIT